MGQDERRSSPRFRAKQGTHIIFVEGFATIKDLSVTGVFVIDPEPLEVGTKIKFALRLGTNDIQLQGVVIRCEPGKGMAIQFTDMTREAVRRIKIYISELAFVDDKTLR